MQKIEPFLSFGSLAAAAAAAAAGILKLCLVSCRWSAVVGQLSLVSCRVIAAASSLREGQGYLTLLCPLLRTFS